MPPLWYTTFTMKKTVFLNDYWEREGDEHTRAFEVEEGFPLTCVFLDLDDLEAGAEVALNGVEVGVAGEVKPDRFNVGKAVRVGPNELVVRSNAEQAPSARLVSCDKVSIERVRIEPEIVGNTANVWINVDVANHTSEEQLALASIVLAQGEAREKVEIAEPITPFGGVVEAVIRVEDPTMWEPGAGGKYPTFDCLVGLQVEDEVMDMAVLTFDLS